MIPELCFYTGIAFGLVAWSLVAARYLWPVLRGQARSDALRPLLVLHAFRFVGLAFLVPGVVAPELPHAFAVAAGVGDLVAAMLALVTLQVLSSRMGLVLAWLFSLWGFGDLVNAFYQAFASGLEPGQLGAMYFIPTAIVPLLLVTHVLAIRILLRPREFPTEPAMATG